MWLRVGRRCLCLLEWWPGDIFASEIACSMKSLKKYYGFSFCLRLSLGLNFLLPRPLRLLRLLRPRRRLRSRWLQCNRHRPSTVIWQNSALSSCFNQDVTHVHLATFHIVIVHDRSVDLPLSVLLHTTPEAPHTYAICSSRNLVTLSARHVNAYNMMHHMAKTVLDQYILY